MDLLRQFTNNSSMSHYNKDSEVISREHEIKLFAKRILRYIISLCSYKERKLHYASNERELTHSSSFMLKQEVAPHFTCAGSVHFTILNLKHCVYDVRWHRHTKVREAYFSLSSCSEKERWDKKSDSELFVNLLQRESLSTSLVWKHPSICLCCTKRDLLTNICMWR